MKKKLIKLIVVGTLYLFFTVLYAGDRTLSLDLNKAITIGLTNSILLKTIRSKQEVFRHIITEKWRNYLPRVGVSYFGLKNLNVEQPDSRYNDIRLNIQQLLYDGGKTELEVESARLDKVLNSKDYLIERDKLSLEISKAYITTLSNFSKLFLVKKSLKRAVHNLKNVSLQKKEGFATDIQRLEALSKLREVEASYRKIQGETNRSLMDLKQVLNLHIDVDIKFEENFLFDYSFYPPSLPIKNIAKKSVATNQEVAKFRVVVKQLKAQKQLAEEYWKPQVSVGAYVGENVNGPVPTKNKVYGFNLSVNTRFGSTTNQNTLNYGVQTDGSGIQRIPGYGPQFVGKGENAFNSSNFNFYDDLSYSRNILEGKIKLSEAVGKYKKLSNEVEMSVYKSYDTLQEKWQLLRLGNSRLYLQFEAFKLARQKFQQGFLKEVDVISAELDLMQAQDGLLEVSRDYMLSGFEFYFFSGSDNNSLHLYEYNRNKGNSIILKLYDYKRDESLKPEIREVEEREKIEITPDTTIIEKKEVPLIEEENYHIKESPKKKKDYDFFIEE
ncbi:MAG: TolC family protein [Leptospiraceae bacterium]|nr:TolC family protein [Leptospiraceae bacterium]